MKFVEISHDTKVFPGEYILHVPTNQVVLCGAFSRSQDMIRALASGKVVVDKISQFRKIELTKEQKRQKRRGNCSNCKGKR